jgi:hypothetical protein
MTLFENIFAIFYLGVFAWYRFETWSVTITEEPYDVCLRIKLPRRVLGPWSEEATNERVKLHTKKLNYLLFPPNIIMVITSRKMRWPAYILIVYIITYGPIARQRPRHTHTANNTGAVFSMVRARTVAMQWALGTLTHARWRRTVIEEVMQAGVLCRSKPSHVFCDA